MSSHRLVSNLRWLVIAYAAQKTATLIGLVFLARYLGETDFGGFAVALALILAHATGVTVNALTVLGFSTSWGPAVAATGLLAG